MPVVLVAFSLVRPLLASTTSAAVINRAGGLLGRGRRCNGSSFGEAGDQAEGRH